MPSSSLPQGRSTRPLLPFAADTSGNALALFALFLPVLLAFTGAALDIGNAVRSKRYLQANLDAATVALASAPDSATEERGQALFSANLKRGSYSGPPPTFTFHGNGIVEAEARMEIKTYLLGLFGFDKLPVVAHAKAGAEFDDQLILNFTVENVKGWFAKDIYAVARDKDGNVVSETKVLSYDYDYATDTKTVDPPIASASQDLSMDGGATVVLKMRVWPDYPLAGSSRNTVPYVDYYSDDPGARLKRTGSCKTGEKYEWEDAPNDIDTSEDDYLDFVFKVRCNKLPGELVNTRLME